MKKWRSTINIRIEHPLSLSLSLSLTEVELQRKIKMRHGNLGKKSAKLTSLEVTTYSHVFASKHFDKQVHVFFQICQKFRIDDYPLPILQLLHKFGTKKTHTLRHTHTHTHTQTHYYERVNYYWAQVTLSHTTAEQQELQGETNAKELVNLSLSITCCRHEEEEVRRSNCIHNNFKAFFPLGQVGYCCCCLLSERESVLL